MDEQEPSRPASEATVGAKTMFFESLDAMLAAGRPLVRPPAPAPAPPPPPPPALTFEAWAELSLRLMGAPPADVAAALATADLTREVWAQLERDYHLALYQDLATGRRELAVVYEAKHKADLARRAGAPAPPPSLPAPRLGPLQGTANSADLGAETWEAMARPPFVPPAPEPEPSEPDKRPAKTVQSPVVPRGFGLTMPLDPGVKQRPTPTLPFAGGAASPGVLPVPTMTARRYVSLRTELLLGLQARDVTLSRYHVPTEAVYRAIEEHWRHPSQRTEYESAVATYLTWMRAELLG